MIIELIGKLYVTPKSDVGCLEPIQLLVENPTPQFNKGSATQKILYMTGFFLIGNKKIY